MLPPLAVALRPTATSTAIAIIDDVTSYDIGFSSRTKTGQDRTPHKLFMHLPITKHAHSPANQQQQQH
jgi:hypothetical protein